MAGPYQTMSEAANDRPAKAMLSDPEERLHVLVHDLTNEASLLEAEARELEDRVMICRARAAGLRTAVRGMEEGLKLFGQQMDKMRAIQKEREEPGPDINAGRRG